MKISIVRRAATAFKNNDFLLAIQLYEDATKLIGKNLFNANISICKKRLNGSTGDLTKENTTICNGELSPNRPPIWLRTPVLSNHTISALANIKFTNGGRKSGVALIRFIDEQGNTIDRNQIPLPQSDFFGANYVYLEDTLTNTKPIFQVIPPSKSVTLEVELRLFEPNKNTSIKINDLRFDKTKEMKKNYKDHNKKTPKEFKVAIIADEFTTNSFSSEFISIPIEPNNWEELFEKHQPDIFFCESAWSGPDSTRRPWQGQIYASVKFQKENRGSLLKILDYCRKNGIPSVFWNKEDPTHYTDRVNDFVKTAKEFDFVFTSAEECIDGYKHEYGVANVFALPFATNPRLFNPVETSNRSSNIVFAGSWYGNHKERSEAMENILDLLQEQGFNMEIYDRYYGSPAEIRKWPERYVPFINPSKPHDGMPDVYKSSCFGLNFNTVTNSSTMFARRVFELMSSNTLVISNYSRGMSEMFGELAIFADREPERLKLLTHMEIENLRERALTTVLRDHTYAKRWRQILSAIGMPHLEEDERVTIASIVRGREDAMLAINWFQQYSVQLPGAQLLLVIETEVGDLEIAKLYQDFNRFGVGVTSMSHAVKYALEGRYRPVETPYFALIDPKNPPQFGWLEKARLHLQYMTNCAIAPATDPRLRYRVASSRVGQPLVGVTSLFAHYLKPITERSEVYYV